MKKLIRYIATIIGGSLVIFCWYIPMWITADRFSIGILTLIFAFLGLIIVFEADWNE